MILGSVFESQVKISISDCHPAKSISSTILNNTLKKLFYPSTLFKDK